MYRSSVFRDPAVIYERNEAKTCKGCKHRIVEMAWGQEIEACRKGRMNTRRCHLYAEVKLHLASNASATCRKAKSS